MRRKPATVAKSRVPKRLRRFVPTEWPGETEWRRYEAWHAAEVEWLGRHPDDVALIEIPGDVAWNPEVDPP